MANQPYYDNKGEFDRSTAYCISGESIYAVFDGKGNCTSFVGITARPFQTS